MEWRDVVLAMDKEEHPSHEEAIVKEKELERRQSRAGRSAIYNRFETHNTKSQTTKYKAENTKYTSMKYKTQITRRQSGAVWSAIYNASEALKLRFATSLSLLHSRPAQRLQPNSNDLCDKKKKKLVTFFERQTLGGHIGRHVNSTSELVCFHTLSVRQNSPLVLLVQNNLKFEIEFGGITPSE